MGSWGQCANIMLEAPTFSFSRLCKHTIVYLKLRFIFRKKSVESRTSSGVSSHWKDVCLVSVSPEVQSLVLKCGWGRGKKGKGFGLGIE